MSVATMLRHRCDVARNSSTGTNGRRKGMQTVDTAIPCMFTPMSDRQAIEGGYTVGQSWTAFFKPDADVRRGDKLTYNGTTYLVKGVRPFQNFGSMSYLQAVVETEQANG